MTFKEAKAQYINELKEAENCRTLAELVARVGEVSIRCGWVDYVDYLNKNGEITERQAQNWGQIL